MSRRTFRHVYSGALATAMRSPGPLVMRGALCGEGTSCPYEMDAVTMAEFADPRFVAESSPFEGGAAFFPSVTGGTVVVGLVVYDPFGGEDGAGGGAPLRWIETGGFPFTTTDGDVTIDFGSAGPFRLTEMLDG